MEIAKILNDFLPEKIFDAHIHLYDESFAENMGIFPENVRLNDFYSDMRKIFVNRKISTNIIPYPSKRIVKESDCLQLSDSFLYNELEKDKNNVGEILVLPDETEEHIDKRIKGKQICGFKCYHTLNKAENAWNLDIQDYLPEAAWRIADRRNMVITLHMVKDSE